eukprot:Selendium_serpulae@DN3760_c0_g1_i1.p1
MRISIPLLLTAALAQHASALFFTLPPYARECVTVYSVVGEKLTGSYECVSRSCDVSLSLMGTSTFIVKEKGSSGRWTHQVDATQNPADSAPSDANARLFQYCIKSTDNVSTTAQFNFRSSPKSAPSNEIATSDHAENIEFDVLNLSDSLEHLIEQQEYSITREATHTSIAESTRQRVLYWAAVQVVAVVVLTGIQTCYLHSSLERKNVV